MTRSLLVLATIFSSGAVLLQKRPFLTPGLQPPDDTVARRSALRSSTHQKVWEMGMTSRASDTRGLLREQSHSSSQVQKKRHLEKQYRGKPGREIWATTASHGAFLLSNRTTALLRTVPQMAYFFFFPSTAEFRRSQPAHEPCWCKREKAQAESNGVHPSMQMPLL